MTPRGRSAGLLTHLVGAVDLGAILQEQLHYVGVASACRPDDGVDTVLLADRQAAGVGRKRGREKGRERGKENL